MADNKAPTASSLLKKHIGVGIINSDILVNCLLSDFPKWKIFVESVRRNYWDYKLCCLCIQNEVGMKQKPIKDIFHDLLNHQC